MSAPTHSLSLSRRVGLKNLTRVALCAPRDAGQALLTREPVPRVRLHMAVRGKAQALCCVSFRPRKKQALLYKLGNAVAQDSNDSNPH